MLESEAIILGVLAHMLLQRYKSLRNYKEKSTGLLNIKDHLGQPGLTIGVRLLVNMTVDILGLGNLTLMSPAKTNTNRLPYKNCKTAVYQCIIYMISSHYYIHIHTYIPCTEICWDGLMTVGFVGIIIFCYRYRCRRKAQFHWRGWPLMHSHLLSLDLYHYGVPSGAHNMHFGTGVRSEISVSSRTRQLLRVYPRCVIVAGLFLPTSVLFLNETA